MEDQTIAHKDSHKEKLKMLGKALEEQLKDSQDSFWRDVVTEDYEIKKAEEEKTHKVALAALENNLANLRGRR